VSEDCQHSSVPDVGGWQSKLQEHVANVLADRSVFGQRRAQALAAETGRHPDVERPAARSGPVSRPKYRCISIKIE
jgi:hypothetical protein